MLRIMKNGLFTWLGIAAVLVAPTAASAQASDGSLDVDEAVRIALRQNYAYQQAVASVGVAEGSRLSAITSMLPFTSGSYSYSDAKTTTTLLDIPTVTVNSLVDPGEPEQVISRGDVPLDSRSDSGNWGLFFREDLSLSQWYNYRSAQADVQSARHGMEAAAQDLAFTVRQQFYLVLRAQDLLTVQTEDLRLARDEERRINSMFELGSVARVDVLKARVRVSDAEVALITQQNAVDIEKARLATLLGLSPDSNLQLAGNLSAEIAPVDSIAAATEAMERPDLLQARENLRSANNIYRAAAWSRLPGLFASFDLNKSSGSSIRDNITQDALLFVPDSSHVTTNLRTFPTDSDTEFDGWTFRVGASVTLDAFINMGQHKRTRSIKKQAEYALEGLELAAQQELEEAILNLRASLSAIEAAESGVESAEEDLRLSQERYQQGLGTILELLEAQVNLTRARNTLVNALTGLKISEAALDKARGAPLPY